MVPTKGKENEMRKQVEKVRVGDRVHLPADRAEEWDEDVLVVCAVKSWKSQVFLYGNFESDGEYTEVPYKAGAQVEVIPR